MEWGHGYACGDRCSQSCDMSNNSQVGKWGRGPRHGQSRRPSVVTAAVFRGLTTNTAFVAVGPQPLGGSAALGRGPGSPEKQPLGCAHMHGIRFTLRAGSCDREAGKSHLRRVGHWAGGPSRADAAAQAGRLPAAKMLPWGRSVFAQVRSSTDWPRPTHARKGNLLHSESTDLNVSLIQKHSRIRAHIRAPRPSRADM